MKKAPMRLDDQHQDAVDVLNEALYRIEHPSPNANSYQMQAGGAWWRLQKVMEWLAPHVEKAGDNQCFVIHGYPEPTERTP